jgi:hypothetical protein
LVAAHLPHDNRQAQIDADLIAISEAWSHLPEPIRAGILAMVRASLPESRRDST